MLGASILGSGQLCMSTGWHDPIDVTVEGSGTFVGNRILWMPDGGTQPNLELAGLALLGSNLPPLEILEAQVGVIFADGFESGTTSAWSSKAP